MEVAVKMEEDRDNFAEKYSEAVFNYLWYTEKTFSDTAIAGTFSAVEVSGNTELGLENVFGLVTESAKIVFVMSILSLRSYNKSVVDYFAEFGISRLSVFTFLSKYCFVNHQATGDIFTVILHTFSLTYRLALYCRKMGHDEFVRFAALCWTEIFEVDMKYDFYRNGGWAAFKTYMAESGYASKDDGDDEKRVLAYFLEDFNDLFSRMERILVSSKTSDDSNKTTDNSEESLVEASDPQASSEASDPQASSEASNRQASSEASDPQASSEASDPQASSEASDPQASSEASDPQASNEASDPQARSEASDPQASSEASNRQDNSEIPEYSFGGVASQIPDLNLKMRSIAYQFIISSLKIKQLLNKSEGEPSDESILPVGESSNNPEPDNATIRDLNLSLQVTETDHCSTEPNSTSGDEVAAVKTSSETREDSKETLV